jgi:hypothetical protein
MKDREYRIKKLNKLAKSYDSNVEMSEILDTKCGEKTDNQIILSCYELMVKMKDEFEDYHINHGELPIELKNLENQINDRYESVHSIISRALDLTGLLDKLREKKNPQ